MSILGGVIRPVQGVAEKAAKAGKLKSIKVKMKFKPGESPSKPGKPDAS